MALELDSSRKQNVLTERSGPVVCGVCVPSSTAAARDHDWILIIRTGTANGELNWPPAALGSSAGPELKNEKGINYKFTG